MKPRRSKLAIVLIIALAIASVLMVVAFMNSWRAGLAIASAERPSSTLSGVRQKINEVNESIVSAALPETSQAIWMDFSARLEELVRLEPSSVMQEAEMAAVMPKVAAARDTVKRASDMLKGGQSTSAVISARGMVREAINSIDRDLMNLERGLDTRIAGSVRSFVGSGLVLIISMLVCFLLVSLLAAELFLRQRRWRIVNTSSMTASSSAVPSLGAVAAAATPMAIAAGSSSEANLTSEDLANRRLKIALEESPLAVVEWNPHHRITRWTGRAEEMFGWRADEVVNHAWSDIEHLHPADRDMVMREVKELVDGKTNRMVIAHRNLHKDGRTLHIVWYNSVIRRPDGSIETFLSLAEDVTARVQAEQQSTKQSGMLRRISEVAPVGLCMMDQTGQVVTANPRHFEIYTGSPRVIDGPVLPCDDVRLYELDGKELPKEQWPPALALRDGQVCREQTFRVEGGTLKEPRYVSVSATPLFDQQGKIETALVVSADITERVQEEMVREQLQAELSQARRMEAVGTFSAGVAHDLGNSLLAVDAAAENLVNATRSGRDVQGAAASLSVATTATRAMSRGLVDYASADTARANMDLVRWLPEGAKFCSWLVPEHVKVKVDTQVEAAPVLASGGQLKRVLMNLVLNARDAVGQNGQIDVTLTKRPALLEKPDAPLGFAELSVRDNGQGMTDVTRRRLFERFFTTKAQGKGSGIGMATVADIVRDHEGTIEIDSAPGQGTTVRVILPLREMPAAAAVAAPAATQSSMYNGAGLAGVRSGGAELPPPLPQPTFSREPVVLQAPQPPVVITPAAISMSPAAALPPAPVPAMPQVAIPAAIMLIAPDGPSRPLMVQSLRNAGAQVMVMNDAEAAWAYARSDLTGGGPGSMPLVIFDLQSPGLDGLSLLRRLRTVDPAAKMLLLGDDEDDLEVEEAPGTQLLVRPFTMAMVRAAVAKLG